MGHLRLSEKHGVNPCIAECYICGKAKNEIILTGKQGERWAREMGRESGEMPMQAVFDINPCEECKQLGIAFIEMSHQARDATPTGRRCLLKEEAVRRMLKPNQTLEVILKKRAALLTPDVYEALGLTQSPEE